MQRNCLAYIVSAILLTSASLPATGPLPEEKPGAASPSKTADDKPQPAQGDVPVPESKPGRAGTQADTPAPPASADKKDDGAGAKPEEQNENQAASPPPPPIEKEDPEELKACLMDLRAMGAEFEEQPAIAGEEPGCGIEHPLKIKKVSQSITISDGAIMRCKTALALAKWSTGMVQPALDVAMPGRKLSGIEHASTYVCRLRNSASTGKISEHARGNAVDIAGFKFSDGTEMIMKKRDEDSTLEGAFQRTATAAACLYFTTVLSPGSDAAHQDHLHLDVLQRHDGYRYCR